MRSLSIAFLLFFLLAGPALAASALSRLDGAWRCDGKSFVQSNKRIREELALKLQADMQKEAGKKMSLEAVLKFLEQKFSESTMTFTMARKECLVVDEGRQQRVGFKVISETPDSVVLEMSGDQVLFTLTGPNAMNMRLHNAPGGSAMPFARKR